jgi:hypothetical protein
MTDIGHPVRFNIESSTFSAVIKGARHRRSLFQFGGGSPMHIAIARGEFLAWCTANARQPKPASLEEFANEKMLYEHPWIAKQRE